MRVRHTLLAEMVRRLVASTCDGTGHPPSLLTGVDLSIRTTFTAALAVLARASLSLVTDLLLAPAVLEEISEW
jgi:hypothetical protein